LQILKIQKEVLGDRHPDTLASVASLAWVYGQQGRHDKVKELEE
jgi:hypothetical protein